MKGIFLTDRGQVRSHNEDAGGIYYNLADQLLAIIADGMGGHQAGDVASQMATSFIRENWEKEKGFSSPDEIENWLKKTISEMNDVIYTHAQNHSECEGMGTTVVIVINVSDFLSVAHIGDSRCYLLNENGFKQITEDHSLVNALVQSGQITKDDAMHHPRKNVVLRALGSDKQVEADVKTLSIDDGDKLLLCSDGLTDKVQDNEIFEFLQVDKSLTEVGQELIDVANNRGGEDNISVILLQKLKDGDTE
ncbi:Stp1/IreP family PP2C-type Ser/Thr phosphatase [Oceanobacillus piezotolerans]|uniref:protein-serine/threonine phosphatase n=1 Tax=Oceanobacillus piezotolerans TaxID=2448030 RepID=A0A498D9H0_9BACI|nr:Stp1/IreP family PP2C-type Ser/Thr phosphatase [Oceanobacillus piezotolerans]RLL45271.1 Stp1/IreP family PP2C-type Ser/Thr phosphatase [Oceanobacillus piezotolerans]